MKIALNYHVIDATLNSEDYERIIKIVEEEKELALILLKYEN